MASKLNVHRILVVPAVLQAGSIYFLSKPTGKADLFIADNSGNRIDVMTDLIINDLIDAKLQALSTTQVVADITERNALTPTEGSESFVIDATGDGTVASGGAKYVYDGTNWVKTSEAESMDINFASLQIAWTQITGGPSSSPTQIDDAVSKAHEHTNLPVLEKFTEDGDGNVNYDGAPIMTEWVTEAF